MDCIADVVFFGSVIVVANSSVVVVSVAVIVLNLSVILVDLVIVAVKLLIVILDRVGCLCQIAVLFISLLIEVLQHLTGAVEGGLGIRHRLLGGLGLLLQRLSSSIIRGLNLGDLVVVVLVLLHPGVLGGNIVGLALALGALTEGIGGLRKQQIIDLPVKVVLQLGLIFFALLNGLAGVLDLFLCIALRGVKGLLLTGEVFVQNVFFFDQILQSFR